MPSRLWTRIIIGALALTATIRAQVTAESIYANDHLIEINIQLAAEDWQNLRIQHRSVGKGFTEKPYRYFEATIEIDGTKFERVGVRKKGFFGSVISTRPSLKIRFDKYVESQIFDGLDQLTLNNNNQDPSHLHQYLAYRLFRDAGSVSPRASLALVTVNGEQLGVYTNVESIRRPFIQRSFGTTKGRLYEGYAGDFDAPDNQLGGIVNKWGKKPGSKLGPIRRLGELLATDPVDLAKVREHIDLDAFITYWATESLIGHWDGYGGNRNNYYLYRHPKTKLFYFIPWGADDIFTDPGPIFTQPVPKSFKAAGLLTGRLWKLPAVRELYQTEMRRLLEDVWIEEDLLFEIELMCELLEDHVDRGKWRQSLAAIHEFLDRRREEVESELVGGGPDWPPNPLLALPTADEGPMTQLTGRFATTFGARDGGRATFVITTPDGKATTPFDSVQVSAMPELPNFIRPGYPAIVIVGKGSGVPEGNLVLIVDPIILELKKPDLPVDHFAVWAMYTEGSPTDPNAKSTVFMISGKLRVDALDMKPGGKIEGAFDLRVPIASK